MRLLTISASDTCYRCKGTGISGEQEMDPLGVRLVKLKVCSCVAVHVIKPKPFAQEVAAHLKGK